MTREEATALMLDVMVEAFNEGCQAALAKKPKFISNPYGGVSWEVGTPAYPANVPKQFREHVAWLRAEWFWGYESVES